ncbi:MAG: nucleoside deaminase [bacterium]
MDAREHSEWMREALKEAQKALEAGDVPVGAVVVDGGVVTGRGYNRVEALKDATAHAEIIAIGAASGARGDWRLDGATLYTTVEPCMMCLGALFLSRISRVVFGTCDKRAGSCGGALRLGDVGYMDRGLVVTGGVLARECQALLAEFFSKLRQADKI